MNRVSRVVAWSNRPHRAMGWVLLPLWALVVWQLIESISNGNWFFIVIGGFASVMLPFSMLWNLGVVKDPTPRGQRCGSKTSR